MEIQKSKKMVGTISLQNDREMTLNTLIIASLCNETTEIKNFFLPQSLTPFLTILQNIGVKTTFVKDTLIVEGTGIQPRTLGDVELTLLDSDYANALLITYIGAQHFDFLHIAGSEIQKESSKTLIGNLPYLIIGEENERGYFVTKESDYIHRDTVKSTHYIHKAQRILSALINQQSLTLSEKAPLRDQLVNTMKAFNAPIDIERTGFQVYETELERRMAQLSKVKVEKEVKTTLKPAQSLTPRKIELFGDPTLAAYFAVAALLIPASDLSIENVLASSTRSGVFNALRRFGANVEITKKREKHGESYCTVKVKYSKTLVGRKFGGDATPSYYEEIPFIAVVASFAQGESIIRNLPEGDPIINKIVTNLRLAGVDVGEIEDGLVIRGRLECDASNFDAYNIPVLALALHALAITCHGGSTLINGEDEILSLFPHYMNDFSKEELDEVQ
ncbi:MAG: hypothetical protein OCD01_03655 [Fibrobacterales bacterium]